MRRIRQRVILYLASKGIYVYRKAHESDFKLRIRIQKNLISRSSGILHIGAHTGQEALFYWEQKKPVIWIEALPNVFEQLRANIADYPNQRAICALLGETNRDLVEFHIADNQGASSSIFRPNENLNPPFKMQSTVSLPMVRLDSLVSKTLIAEFDHWIIDVQGAELAVLSGAGELINSCNSLVIEGKEESYYSGGTSYSVLRSKLESLGFIPLWDIEENVEDNVFYVRVNDHAA